MFASVALAAGCGPDDVDTSWIVGAYYESSIGEIPVGADRLEKLEFFEDGSAATTIHTCGNDLRRQDAEWRMNGDLVELVGVDGGRVPWFDRGGPESVSFREAGCDEIEMVFDGRGTGTFFTRGSVCLEEEPRDDDTGHPGCAARWCDSAPEERCG